MTAPLVPSGSGRPSTARRQPAAERVAAALRSTILDGTLEGGARINQQRWAHQLGVSRAALREGLKLLTAENLLCHEGHRGYFVAAADLAQLQQIYWLRVQIEREVLLSCRVPDEQEGEELGTACHAALAAADAGDRPARYAAERRFFFGIYALSPFRFLGSEAMRLWDLAEVYRSMLASLLPASVTSLGDVRERRLLQLEAARSGDWWTLVESVVNERRRTVAVLAGPGQTDEDDRPACNGRAAAPSRGARADALVSTVGMVPSTAHEAAS